MAKITHSELAPAEKVVYTLANEQFELTAKGTYESDDPVVLANAETHPWLAVEYPEVAPEDAPDEAVQIIGLAVEAGQDQKETLFEGRTPVTLSADDAAPEAVDEEGEATEPPPPPSDPEPDYEEKFE